MLEYGVAAIWASWLGRSGTIVRRVAERSEFRGRLRSWILGVEVNEGQSDAA